MRSGRCAFAATYCCSHRLLVHWWQFGRCNTGRDSLVSHVRLPTDRVAAFGPARLPNTLCPARLGS